MRNTVEDPYKCSEDLNVDGGWVECEKYDTANHTKHQAYSERLGVEIQWEYKEDA